MSWLEYICVLARMYVCPGQQTSVSWLEYICVMASRHACRFPSIPYRFDKIFATIPLEIDGGIGFDGGVLIYSLQKNDGEILIHLSENLLKDSDLFSINLVVRVLSFLTN